MARILNDQRNPGSALIDPALSFRSGQIAGGRAFACGESAVIRSEYHHGILLFSALRKRLQQPSDILIQIPDHSRVGRIRLNHSSDHAPSLLILGMVEFSFHQGRLLIEPLLSRLLLEALPVLILHLYRCMYRVMA